MSKLSSFLDDPTGAKAGAKEQEKGLRRAAKIEKRAAEQAIKLRNQFLDETSTQREAARDATLQLQNEINAPMGSSPLFTRSLEAGMRDLQGSLAGYGLQDSSVNAVTSGELVSGLSAQELNQRRAMLGQLSQYGTEGFGLALGAQQIASGLKARRAQTFADIGAVNAQARGANTAFWGNVIGTGAAIGATMIGGPAAGAAVYGATNAMTSQTSSPYTMTEPTYGSYLGAGG